ncbi:MAG: sigma-70 family RNA polymerase sigma factor [Myxococcota bacterium]
MGVDLRNWYQQYGLMVHCRCRALLRDDEEAREVMQDVFVEVLRRGDALQVDAPSSFLYRTATNLCLNRLRTCKRKPSEPDTDLLARIAVAPEAEDRSITRPARPRVPARAAVHARDGGDAPGRRDDPRKRVAETDVGLGVRKRLRVLKAHVAELQEVA